MDDSSVSSGFIDVDSQSGQMSFADLQEVYVSASGYGRLFRCQRYNRLHMLKALKPAFVGNPFYEQALRKEFDIGYQLEHPHVCRALGWETLPGLGHCIVMEYIDGLTLREFMEQGRLTPELARKFVQELCSALGYLHGKQIVHRDLKPENILVTYNGNNIKLIDFGLSDCDDYDALKLPAGTRYYLAPEALKPGQPLDLRADIYSLGIILGEMAERLKDKRLAAVSRRCTRRRPEDRYPSASAVARDVAGDHSHLHLYRWSAAVGALLLVVGIYTYYNSRKTVLSPVDFPVYGNLSLPVDKWAQLTDSIGVETAVVSEYPVPAQRQSVAFGLCREALHRQRKAR